MTTEATEETGADYFTVVFKGDVRKFHGNPFKLFEKTEGLEPVAISVGDALSELDKLKEAQP